MDVVIAIALTLILAAVWFNLILTGPRQDREQREPDLDEAQTTENASEKLPSEDNRRPGAEEDNEGSATSSRPQTIPKAKYSSKSTIDYENLRKAITQSSLPDIQRLITSDVHLDLDYQYEDGKRPLHVACEHSTFAVSKLLLDQGANPAERDRAGQTLLLSAVEQGRMDIVKDMINLHADLLVRDIKGRTAILIAVERDDARMLQELYLGCNPRPIDHMDAIQVGRAFNKPEATEFLEKEETLQLVQRHLKTRATTSSAPELIGIASSCLTFFDIVNRRIAKPDSCTDYVKQIIQAANGISEAMKDKSELRHGLTLEERRLFATVYQAYFADSAKNNESSADHLVVAKIIAKTLRLESEIDMNRPIGREPRLCTLSSVSISTEDTPQLLQFIGRCLVENRDPDSFGSIFNVGISTNTMVMCCVFGSRNPNKFKAPKELRCGNTSMLVLIIADWIQKAATGDTPPTSWINKAVRSSAKIDLSGHSVGEKADMQCAGSFGFYGIDEKEKLTGFTGAHCTPNAKSGAIIVSPSTLELMGRLKVVVPYTSYALEQKKKWRISKKETEVESLFQDWLVEDSDEGFEIRNLHKLGQTQKIVLNGQHLGRVVGKSANYVRGVLEKHNTLIKQQGSSRETLGKHEVSGFNLPYGKNELGKKGGVTRIEWCCFEVPKDRCGGNRLNSDTWEDEAVKSTTLLKPDMLVSKIGRTTGETEGTVHGCIIQIWADECLSTEIAVLGTANIFAHSFAGSGDSGSLVTTVEQSPRAVGMLVGIDAKGYLGLVSLLWAVLEDVEATLGHKIGFYTE